MRPTIPLKRLVDPGRPITYGIVQAGEDVVDGVRYIRPVDMDGHRGVNPGSLRTTNPEIAAAYTRSALKPGDVVVSIGPSFGKTMLVPDELDGANLTQGTARVAVRPGVEARFIVWALQAQTSVDFWETSIGGATFRALNLGPLAETPIPMPSREEQRAIADYLDRETARIDMLIEEQQRLIEMLHERRRAVADGLLGVRVGHGERLKWSFEEIDRRAGAEAATLPLMSVSIAWGVRRRDEVTDDETRAEDLSSYKVCRRGELVINRMRAFQGALGLAPDDGIVSPDYAVLRASGAVDAPWLASVMKTGAFVSEMAQRVKGIGSADLGNARTPRINISDLAEIRVAVPEIQRQRVEVAEVSAQMEKIGQLVAEAERFIALSRERRAALITAAVTGQIDVPELV